MRDEVDDKGRTTPPPVDDDDALDCFDLVVDVVLDCKFIFLLPGGPAPVRSLLDDFPLLLVVVVVFCSFASTFPSALMWKTPLDATAAFAESLLVSNGLLPYC